MKNFKRILLVNYIIVLFLHVVTSIKIIRTKKHPTPALLQVRN